ncbi:hypothetical protein ES896_19920 [Bacillus sp. 005/A4HT-01/001]|nr:hypothetical protein ES896_19920 [Bacillus sp. 005/A4HT-01/001]
MDKWSVSGRSFFSSDREVITSKTATSAGVISSTFWGHFFARLCLVPHHKWGQKPLMLFSLFLFMVWQFCRFCHITAFFS